jgi:hypothetical protein
MSPSLILSAGMIGAGKTTICKKLAKAMPDSFYLDRDDVLQGLLHVAPTSTTELPSFEEYVVKDQVYPDNARSVDTPFGEMVQVDPLNAFNRRHGRDQSYLVQSCLAKTGLLIGKTSILDCFLTRQLNDGTLARFISWDYWIDFPVFLIWFSVSPTVCWERLSTRAKVDEVAARRSKEFLNDKDNFEVALKTKHPYKPEGLARLRHLFIDTSNLTVQDVVSRCINYVSLRSNASNVERFWIK